MKTVWIALVAPVLVLVWGGTPAPAAESAAPAPVAPEERPYPHGTFNQDCAGCHSAERWSPAVPGSGFNHARFGFPLDGVHRQSSCRACHLSLKFAEVKPARECVACHGDVHQGEFGNDCSRCHTARSFVDPSRMRRAHLATRFPLVGAHLAADCDRCHRPADQGHLKYVNLDPQCEACHLADYQATTNPNHTILGFPTDCQSCHRPVSWHPARFPNHDAFYFPIFSGTHRGKWSTCTDCHIQSGIYSVFSCTDCHQHDDPTKVTNDHSGVGGFTYTPTSCYGCHPDGRKP